MSWISAAWSWTNEQAAGLTVLVTLVATLVAGIYAWLTRKLWRATQKAAEMAQLQAAVAKQQADTTSEMVILSRQVFEADHRPWLSIVVEWGTPMYRQLTFRLENHGRAPAIVNDWKVSVTPAQAGSPQTPGSKMSAVFPGQSDNRPPVVFDDEFIKWDRHGLEVTVVARAGYYWADETRARPYSTTVAVAIRYGGILSVEEVLAP